MEKVTEQIPPDREESELDIETQELQVEELDFWTLSFLKEHIDMPERIDLDPSNELAKIKRAIDESPKEGQSNQRMLLMGDFKRRLKKLRENMATAQLELEHFIRENPEISADELFTTVREIAARNNVSNQANYFFTAADAYLLAHFNIIDTIEHYKISYSDKWQNQLFEDLFGQPPRGPIEIEVMPMNVYIKITSIEDYVVANGVPDNVARNSGGASLQKEFPKVKLLSYKVLIENMSLSSPRYSKEVVKPHEEEHSIHNNIYPRSAFIKGESNWLKDIDHNQEIEPSLFYEVANKSITNILLADWFFEAKTEILAYMKTGKALNDIKLTLTDPDGLYNYFIDSAEIHTNWFFNHLERAGIKVKVKDNDHLGADAAKMLYKYLLEEAWHKRYLPKLEKIFQALEKILSQYGSDKYPEIMRLLAQEPLNKWPRLAKILS